MRACICLKRFHSKIIAFCFVVTVLMLKKRMSPQAQIYNADTLTVYINIELSAIKLDCSNGISICLMHVYNIVLTALDTFIVCAFCFFV